MSRRCGPPSRIARAGALRLRARRIFTSGRSCSRRSGCCGTGCGWCSWSMSWSSAALESALRHARRVRVRDSVVGAADLAPGRASRRARCGASRWRAAAGRTSALSAATISKTPSGGSSALGAEHGRRAPAPPPPPPRSGAAVACRPAAAARRDRPVSRAGSAAVSVAIVDYGSGNLHSAAKAFERAAHESRPAISRSS